MATPGTAVTISKPKRIFLDELIAYIKGFQAVAKYKEENVGLWKMQHLPEADAEQIEQMVDGYYEPYAVYRNYIGLRKTFLDELPEPIKEMLAHIEKQDTWPNLADNHPHLKKIYENEMNSPASIAFILPEMPAPETFCDDSIQDDWRDDCKLFLKVLKAHCAEAAPDDRADYELAIDRFIALAKLLNRSGDLLAVGCQTQNGIALSRKKIEKHGLSGEDGPLNDARDVMRAEMRRAFTAHARGISHVSQEEWSSILMKAAFANTDLITYRLCELDGKQPHGLTYNYLSKDPSDVTFEKFNEEVDKVAKRLEKAKELLKTCVISREKNGKADTVVWRLKKYKAPMRDPEIESNMAADFVCAMIQGSPGAEVKETKNGLTLSLPLEQARNSDNYLGIEERLRTLQNTRRQKGRQAD